MNNRLRLKQAWTIARIELRRAFISKRAFWVYGLALLPAIIFFGHSVAVKFRRERLSAKGLVRPAVMDSIRPGEAVEAVLERLGKPPRDFQWERYRRIRPKGEAAGITAHEIISHRRLTYFDGQREAILNFTDGKLISSQIRRLLSFEEDRRIFAGVFQYFYLRLAVFFGCLGIFMNLFRGEMLDKTLHFWLLAPARREVLLAGKYGAGLIASAVIFAGGALLCFGVLLWTHNPAEVQAYWRSSGMGHVFWYAAAAVLGCIGYGSIFLAAGLLLRNPVIPAAVLLAWEGINNFLPEILQKLSVLYYLQSLCPVPAPVDKSMPAILQLLLAPAAPASRAGAILGLLSVTAFVLWLACLAVRRMQISTVLRRRNLC